MLKLKLILWPPDGKRRLTGKDSGARKDWRQEEKGITEDKMVGWHHRLNGYEFEQTPGDGEWQTSLACCSPWGGKVRHNFAIEQQFKVHTFFHISKVPFDMYGNIFIDFGDKNIDIPGGYYYAYQIISLVFYG